MYADNLTQLAINTIRTLSMDAVQAAQSGHPGTPMALAPLVYTIWNRVMRFDPRDPIWPNRDQFVLSNGGVISGAGSRAAVRVIRTDEGQMIAKTVCRVLGLGGKRRIET
jgi:transketolase N-terminal domain/subunit